MAVINYQLAAAEVDPNVSFAFAATPTVYESLIFKTEVVSKADCESTWLASEKVKQIGMLVTAAQTAAIGGFISDALVPGTPRGYQSNLQTQIVIVGALEYLSPGPAGTVQATSYTLPSVNLTTGQTGFNSYNYVQFYKLFGDMAAFSASVYNQLAVKTAAIEAVGSTDVLADLDAVYAIVWV